jgi:ribonuclease Z
MNLTITGYSTALFSTWYFIEELGILFDAGDGLIAGLLQKSRKIKNVFVSHADRDHLTGLLQLNQLIADTFPVFHYPQDCTSFPYMDEFFKRFDPHQVGTVWKSVIDKEQIRIQDDIVVEAIKNGHVVTDESFVKSLSYKVFQLKRKLKPEYAKLSGKEIKELIEAKGKENVTDEIRTNLISYSGDTPVEDFSRFDGSEVLIHEATFLSKQDIKLQPHKHRHSSLEEVMEMVATIQVGKLILGHFSSRYSAEEICLKIKELCEKYHIKIPVYAVLPGEIVRDILNLQPVNQ